MAIIALGGDGTCDRIITITADGNSRHLNVNKRG